MRDVPERVNLVRAGDPLITGPCGSRITWTTALVLEALLGLGCEHRERVRMALRALTISPEWCDNIYQHGLSSWRRTEPYSMDEINEFEAGRVQQFRYGVIGSLTELTKADTSHVPFYLRRMARVSASDGDEYPLGMPGVQEGCRIIMTRAPSQVRDSKVRRLAKARLWGFAAGQHAADGAFAGGAE